MTREETAADERARELRVFLDAHYRRVVGAVSLVTGDRSSAEDAVQNAIVKAWERNDEPIERLVAWITVVATNDARDTGRRRAAQGRAIERLGHRADHTAATLPEPDEQLAAALAGLPLRERQATVLHYVHDLSVADVARSMEVSDGTVKTLLSRARAHLADALTTNGGPS